MIWTHLPQLALEGCGRRLMENGTGRRITVSAIAGTVLAAALAGVVSQTSGYATKASGTDAYLYGMALEAMGNFTDVTGSLPFLAITALAVGAAIYAWGDFVWRAWATRWRSRSRLSLRSPDRKLIAMSLMFIFGGGLALSALWYAGERYLVKSEPTTKRAKVEVKPAITPNIDGAQLSENLGDLSQGAS